MTITDFDAWARSLLEIEAFASIDASLNGIQVGRSDGPLARLAFAVDASAESIRRAAEAGAQVLFVHHGLFWGKPRRIDGSLKARLKLLLDADLALYACHLPLDSHPELGNNAQLAMALGLEGLAPFSSYHGVKLGWKGSYSTPLSLDAILARLGKAASSPLCLIQAGPKEISTVGIVSGGAANDVMAAIEEGLDLFITGEASHTVYSEVVEAGIHFAALGHYATETYGVRSVARRLAEQTGLETLFLDLPTGL
jgi:dinuclear metal center YbgI/SA1388 family protein